MSSTTVERLRPQPDRDRRPISPADVVRPREMHAAEDLTPQPGPHAGFDADLNPIDDEFINTHGSER